MTSFDKAGFFFVLKFISILALSMISFQYLFGMFLEDIHYASDFYTQSSTASVLDIRKKDKEDILPLRLAFVGDIMLDRGVRNAVFKYGDGDWRFPFLLIYETLSKYDLLFANLEGPISDRGENAGSIYSFRMPPAVIDGFKFAGFDVLSIANNHIADWGKIAVEDTINHLDRVGILAVGAGKGAYDPKIIEIKKIKIAFIAFSDVVSGDDVARLPRDFEETIKTAVAQARLLADIVIVSFHFGDEYLSEPTTRQIAISHMAIDLGVDLVIGTHPHVVGPVENYKNGYIAYSLGNFVFDQNFSEDTMRGMLLEIEIDKTQKIISNIVAKEVNINPFFQVSISTH